MVASDRIGFWSMARNSVTGGCLLPRMAGRHKRNPTLGWERSGHGDRAPDAEGSGTQAKNHEIELAPAVPQNRNNGHRSLATAVAEFLEETKLTKNPETLAAYTIQGPATERTPAAD